MPTPTYTPLATITLGSSASSATFSSIPATYRDLILIADVIGTGTSVASFVLNNDTTSANYNRVVFLGDGSFNQQGSFNSNAAFGIDSSVRTLGIFEIQDSSATDKDKTTLYRVTKPNSETLMGAMRRSSNTAAVTSIQLSTTGSFATGSRFDLYGIVS
jgi:hypothetical protein